MPAAPRSLPDHPDLRYLKLEAKRRHAAGEFPSLHDAQTAIAREHGLPSWAALKQRVTAELDGHALIQLRWVMSRWAGAGEPGWTAPGDDELRQHFAQSFLSALPPALWFRPSAGWPRSCAAASSSSGARARCRPTSS
jgi:hypothetical protein